MTKIQVTYVQNLSYWNAFDLHENESFRMWTLFDTRQRKKDNSEMAYCVCKAQQYTIKVLMFQTDFLNRHYSLFYARFIQSSACLSTFPFGWAKLNVGCYERIHRQPKLFQYQVTEL